MFGFTCFVFDKSCTCTYYNIQKRILINIIKQHINSLITNIFVHILDVNKLQFTCPIWGLDFVLRDLSIKTVHAQFNIFQTNL